ncbi:MAG: 4'-phosphopantetheinyl transferase superfamily protein [Bacteroidales bacterium]|nr:4'-phosphopantetheinyl transferase superfamily protein [Bacteroidales bacterium]
MVLNNETLINNCNKLKEQYSDLTCRTTNDGSLIVIIKRIQDEVYLRSQLALHPDDENRLLKITAPKRIQEWLTSRFLLKKLFEEDVTIRYTSFGKPYIKQCFIGISHSPTHVGFILSDKQNVAIDIEQCTERIERLYTKFISEKESYFLDKDLKSKTLIWSAKEALYKLGYHDLPDFMQSYEIEPFSINETEGIFKGKVRSAVFEHTYTLNYFFIDNNVVVWTKKNHE